MKRSEVTDALARLRAGVDALLSADLASLAATEVTCSLAELEVERRRLDAVDVRLVAEVEERRIAGECARSSTADLLTQLLRVTPGEAKARTRRAGDLGPRRTLTGETLGPLQPRVAEALTVGSISVEHAAVVARCLDHVPAAIAAEAEPVAEQMLVRAAHHQHPGALARTAALLLTRLDPDGTEPREDELARRRDFGLRKRGDGMSQPTGLLTPEATAVWETILDALAAPAPAAEGLADERSPGQRRHDALVDAGMRLLSSETLPPAGGAPVTVLVTVAEADLRATTEVGDNAELGVARDAGVAGSSACVPDELTLLRSSRPPLGVAITAHGDVWPLSRLRLSACEANFVPVVFNEAGAALRLGRSRRLATRAQRLALIARDHGCVFPGCDRPAAWCEVHHVIEWVDGGPTDIDNMCLLCRFHHREFAGRGWRVRMRDGTPEWLPPPFIDPDQRPIRNTVHHPPDIVFRRRSVAS